MQYQYIVTISNGDTSPGLDDMNEVVEWLLFNAGDNFWLTTSKKKKEIHIERKRKAQVCCAHCDCNEYRPTTIEGSACECGHAVIDHNTGSKEALVKRLTKKAREERSREVSQGNTMDTQSNAI